MFSYWFQPRSHADDYDDPDSGGSANDTGCSDILLFPFRLILMFVFMLLISLSPLIYLIWYILSHLYTFLKSGTKDMKPLKLFLLTSLILLALLSVAVLGLRSRSAVPLTLTKTASSGSLPENHAVNILLDDFRPQPYQGENVYYFNRFEGDRGAVNESNLTWSYGRVAIRLKNSWGGLWMSLNHPIREGQPVNFSAVLPAQILPAYQSRMTGITILIDRGTQGRTFRVELKDGDRLCWKKEFVLNGWTQTLTSDLPDLGNVNQLVLVLDQASKGDEVVVERISFRATTRITDPAVAAFAWSYGMLLDNWNPATGLVRDKAKDASGEFDAIQSTGSLAAATAVAEQLGVINRTDAVRIVKKISDALLVGAPRFHGLWPHWVKVSSAGKITPMPDTEWSSVDTVIAALGLLDAQNALEMNTYGAESLLREIDWKDLVTPKGISHGYSYTGERIPYAWDAFGGESWLVELAYAASTGQVAPLAYPAPPTANGSGFIDELAWLYLPPPARADYWGTDWTAYREAAVNAQIQYYPAHAPESCFTRLGLFGLSAGEEPFPSRVPPKNIYQAFGIGGHFAPAANDGSLSQGAPVVAPHYSAMVALLRPQESIKMWEWLMNNGYFSPLTNVESLMFPDHSTCGVDTAVWNQLKGSWNLSLQALGWGRYLASRDGKEPILWQAAGANAFLRKGYSLLVPDRAVPTSPPAPTSTPDSVGYERECENPDVSTAGQMIWRSNASGQKVHGQFGTTASSPWPAQPGYVEYKNIQISKTGPLFLKLRYSKNSPSSVPIRVNVDEEPGARAVINLTDQGSWDQFAWAGPIATGEVSRGVHSIKLSTDGEPYGVADLDQFVLLAEGLPATATPAPVRSPQPSQPPPLAIGGNDTLISCDGKPFSMWILPGTYIYRRTTDKDNPYFVTIKRTSRWEGSLQSGCADIPGCFKGEQNIPNSTSRTSTGVEEVTTGWGTFRAFSVEASQSYNTVTGRMDVIQGTIQAKYWYICGYGVLRTIESESGIKMGMKYGSSSELVLVSYTPISTNESRVRYILADIQLRNTAEDYRAHRVDEETAEALRRWDAGIRVLNFDQFWCKNINGQWQVVYAGTEKQIDGMDVLLNSDPKP